MRDYSARLSERHRKLPKVSGKLVRFIEHILTCNVVRTAS
jgi:hypothetical protein